MDGKIQIRHTVPDRILEAGSLLLTAGTTLYLLFGWDSFPERIPAHYNAAGEIDRCRTDFADIQNKKECGGNRQWQNHYLRNWAANTKGKGII